MLAIDDFGTGYSSLSYLGQFPIDVVKLDRSFVAGFERIVASHTIVSAVIQLAHDLGMTVVAEGVETAEQHLEVTRLGCDSCQGFYFATTHGRLRASRRSCNTVSTVADPRLPVAIGSSFTYTSQSLAVRFTHAARIRSSRCRPSDPHGGDGPQAREQSSGRTRSRRTRHS